MSGDRESLLAYFNQRLGTLKERMKRTDMQVVYDECVEQIAHYQGLIAKLGGA